MSYYETPENRGFNFTNFKRNKYILEEAGANPPKFKKTGTTIVGVVCKDGVVMATDTRATGGSTVMEKNCQKLHYMAPNIYCAGAGTAADCDKMTGEYFYIQLDVNGAYFKLESGKMVKIREECLFQPFFILQFAN